MTTLTPTTPAETLRKAATEVRKGWCQHALQDALGNVCALGAIGRVTTGNAVNGFYSETGVLSAKVLSDAVGVDNHFGGIAIWNNAPGRTAEDVALAMEFAALCWEQEQLGLKPQPESVTC